MSPKDARKRYIDYYDNCLIQFLGFEKDIYTTRQKNVYTFYHYSMGRMKLYTAVNKIYQISGRKWITNADQFLLRFVLFDKSCPTFQEYYGHTLF